MKTKEYINKYYLNVSDKFNHNDFIGDLTIDFMTLLEVGNSTKNVKGFDNAVRAIRMKWDAINNKTVGQLPDKLWGYFYAKVIIGYKKELFPEVLARQERERKERERRRKDSDAFYGNNFNAGFFFNDIFTSFLASLFKTASIPQDSFVKLGLDDTASIDQVKESYRTLALLHHPDRGGNNDLFIAITEAKNKCLMYLQNKTI